MSCDPVKGLVQIPFMAGNALDAIKAFSSASLALRADCTNLVQLDACSETMRQSGLDMSNKCIKTLLGSLTVTVPKC